MSNCKELWIEKENINISKPQGKTTNWENGMEYHRKRERHMDRKREKRGMQCYMKKEDNSLIDVENAETTGERCRHLS